MSVGQPVSDILRTAIVCATVALLGWFGFQLAQHPVDNDVGAQRSVEDSFKVYMLVARYEGDEVHVYGRVACLRNTWKSVELSFIFRGHHDAKLYRHQHNLPGISASSPMDAGMKREFDFSIPKFHNSFLEDNVSATVAGEPLRDP